MHQDMRASVFEIAGTMLQIGIPCIHGPFRRIIRAPRMLDAACATPARHASERKSLRIHRLRVGLVTGRK